MVPSDEQMVILEKIQQGSNVIVDAVAGSGKSTTVLYMAKIQESQQKNMIQITYNSSLRHEIKEKAAKNKLTHLEVHTFHSLAVRYYMPHAFTDTELREIVHKKMQPVCPIPFFPCVVLDEVQDMTPLYFHFIRKWIHDMAEGQKIQLVILGDWMQGLYEFKGSDIRFLTRAEALWRDFGPLKTSVFTLCSLHMSYRITNPMAKFINHVMLGEKRLMACKEGPKVMYVRNSGYYLHMVLLNIIRSILNSGNRPDDIFILGGSVKKSIRKLENVLVENNIPCYVPREDQNAMDDRVMVGKVIFSSFHSVKGRQRKFVIVMGFDNQYFNFYAKTLNPNTCPNTLYVACTRASECLFVVENDSHPDYSYLPFLKMNHLQMKSQDYIDFRGALQMIRTKSQNTGVLSKSDVHFITPTELIKFIPETTWEQLTPLVDSSVEDGSNGVDCLFECIVAASDETFIPVPKVVVVALTDNTERAEDVSDINGVAIPAYFFEKRLQIQNIHFMLKTACQQTTCGENEVLIQAYDQYNKMLGERTGGERERTGGERERTGGERERTNGERDAETFSDFLFLSNLYLSFQDKLYFKFFQIPKDQYTWLSEDMIDQCLDRMSHLIRLEDHPQCEITIVQPQLKEEHDRINAVLSPFFPKKKFVFTARVDILSDTTIWEIKCVNHLSVEHYLQVLVYAWLWKVMYSDVTMQFKLFNIQTNELFVLKPTVSLTTLTSVVVLLLESKYKKPVVFTDAEFFHSLR
jgi:hypothetical protein